jgi:hypothetical protein
MKRSILVVGMIAVVLAATNSAMAILIDRGAGLIYDTDLDITWLQDANFCGTNPTNPACILGGAVQGGDLQGAIFWAGAQAWADNLTYGGFDDWRLPTTTQPDSSCSIQLDGRGFGFGCRLSEMGHLRTVEGVSLGTPGLFTNIPVFNFHWSSTDDETNPTSRAWIFQFNNGFQTTFSKGDGPGFAWAVRDGDVIGEVRIDIRPRHCPNRINPRRGGLVPVAILTTDAVDNAPTFDATAVNPTTVRFGVAGTEAAPGRVVLKDVDGDGDIDMVLRFDTQDTGITCRTKSANLTGETLLGRRIKGTDFIKTVGCNGGHDDSDVDDVDEDL